MHCLDVGRLESTSRSPTCWHFPYTVSKASHLFMSRTTTPEKALSAVSLSTSWWQMLVFRNADFHFKAQILSMATTTFRRFLGSVTFSLLRKTCALYPRPSITLSHSFRGTAASWACNSNSPRSAFPRAPACIRLECQFRCANVMTDGSGPDMTIITNYTGKDTGMTGTFWGHCLDWS